MSVLGWIGLVNGITSLSLGIFVLSRNSTSTLHRIYFITNLTVAAYSFGYGFWQFSSTYNQAFFWFRVLFNGTILINVMYLYFAFALTGELHTRKRFLWLFTALNIALIPIHHAGWFYNQLEPRFGMGLWPVPKPALHVYVLFWHLVCFYGCFYLWRKSLNADVQLKQQIKLVMLACGIGYLGGATNWFMWYSVPVTPAPTITISVYVALIGYAIVRHRLMDFGLLFRWGLAYASIALALTAVFSLIVLSSKALASSYAGINNGLVPLIFFCALTLFFEPAKLYVKGTIDRFVFRSPDFQVPLERIERLLGEDETIEVVCEKLSEELEKVWKAEFSGFAVWDLHLSTFRFLPKNRFANFPIARIDRQIDRSDFLIRTLETERRLFAHGIVVEGEVSRLGFRSLPGERTTFWKIRRTMRWLGADICVPLCYASDLIGFAILGKKRTGLSYNDEDKKFLAHVATKLSERFWMLLVNGHEKPQAANLG